MEQFRFEDLDITRASNETIAELGEEIGRASCRERV